VDNSILNKSLYDFEQQLNQHKSYFNSHITRDLKWRRQQLLQIKRLVIENESAFIKALHQDLNKPELEAWTTEVSYVTGDVDHMLKHLKSWSKARKVKTPIVAQPGWSYIQAEPQGTVLIMGAWNYPMQLVFAPLIAVIAAGNCAVIKPSELAPQTSKLVAELVPKYLDKEAISVVEGAVEETTELLKLPFDHIMYTGNGAVARIVMTAAAKNLTPVTLELGGKSPVYIDSTANLAITAQRLAWGKWMNAGQTCIAPDYILVTKETVAPLIAQLKSQIESMFGKEPKDSDSYGRIINQRHCQRIANYLSVEGSTDSEESTRDGELVIGGDFDIDKRYISPTVVLNPSLTGKMMTDEIFGPILPIIIIESFSKAKEYIINQDKPLAAYIFTKNKSQEQEWVSQISAGSQCVNDVIMFNAVPDLPFGGTGPSGMGQYSGKAGFDNFSHLKSVLKRPFIKDLPVRFAPYTDLKFKLLKMIR